MMESHDCSTQRGRRCSQESVGLILRRTEFLIFFLKYVFVRKVTHVLSVACMGCAWLPVSRLQIGKVTNASLGRLRGEEMN